MPGVVGTESAIVALNAGSSSIKFGLFGQGKEPVLVARGAIEDFDQAPSLKIVDSANHVLASRSWDNGAGHDRLLGDLLDWIEDFLAGATLLGAGHRIVHGGDRFLAPTVVSPQVLDELRALTPLAPLHQPLGLAPIDALRRVRPHLTQIACFDTAFHRHMRPPASRYALPREFELRGIRKYGFHGLSYEYIASQLGAIDPGLPTRRTVVAHLGSGASLCAMRDGRSIDTTMGFSALDGLVMATRPGAVDPGVLLYLVKEQHMAPNRLEDLLYHQSGLLGVSGMSGDMRALLASDDPRAGEAVELFVFRLAQQIAAMAASLGGLDALVFTGGIGEHAAAIRALVAARLGWLGVAIDADANRAGAQRISTSTGSVDVLIIATNEELTIARQTAALLVA